MIVILNTPRSFSARLAEQIAKEKKYYNMGETFHIGQFTKEDMTFHRNTIVTNSETVCKISYDQWDNATRILEENIIPTVTDAAEEVITIVRRDYVAQLKSYYLSMKTGIWDYTWPEAQEHVLDTDLLNECDIFLRKSYAEMKKVYDGLHEHKNKRIVYTEDLFDTADEYDNPQTFAAFPDNIDFDPVTFFES